MPQRTTLRRTGRLAIATLVVLATTLLFAPASDAVERPTPDYCLSAITTVPLTGESYGMAVDPSTGLIFVVRGSVGVDVLDPTTKAIVNNYPFPVDDLGFVAVDRAADRLYVGSYPNDKVYVVRLSNKTAVTTYDVESPQNLAIDTAHKKLYVGSGTTSVSAVNLQTGVVHGIPMGGSSLGIALNPSGSVLYAPDYTNGTLDVINTATETVVHEWDLPGPTNNQPLTAAWDETTGHVWVATRSPGRVEEVDPASGAIGVSFAFAHAQGLALNAAVGEGYVSPDSGTTARSFRLADGVKIKDFTVGQSALSIVATAAPLRAYVSSLDDGDVAIFGAGAGPFPDVPGTNPFCTNITWMVSQGITNGYLDGTFKPTAPVTRQSIAAFLYRLSGSPAFTPPATPTFKDVPKTHAFSKEIEWLASKGIATGYGDDTYRPALAISRQAVAAFLSKMVAPPSYVPPPTATFTDVPLGHPFRKQIELLVEMKIITGYADHTFHPNDPVSRQAIAAFLYRTPLF